MIETFCKEHELTLFECVACQREKFELEHEEKLAALREENERLRNANPWRYPSRGELPDESRRWCNVTLHDNTVAPVFYPAFVVASANSDVRAWKYADEQPAPVLEDE